MKPLRKLMEFLRDQRGQAMAEYSTLTFMILIGTGVAMTGFAMPATKFGQHVTLAQAIYGALQTYVDSFYYSLHLLAP